MALIEAAAMAASSMNLCLKFNYSFNKNLSSVKLGGISISPSPSPSPSPSSPAAAASLKFTLSQPTRKLRGFHFQLHSAAVESVEAVQEQVEKSTKPQGRRKLFVQNLPWSLTVADIKNLFSECGTVSDVEIIKQKDGKARGFAFVTMASGEEAQAAVEKFDSFELVGRIIKVEFAKRFKKPARPVPTAPPPGETRYKLYVSNLAWKVRSDNLREFFSSNFNPVSARVVFDSGRSAGYGFVSFATKEEAESAISVLDGKELLGRPIRLTFSEKNSDASETTEESNSDASESKEESGEQQPAES